jgi:REP element-mobilizing transposase RayT
VKPRHRNERAGATYHVMARGVDRRRIFVDAEDCELYTRLLCHVTQRQGWRLMAYCLMPNHVHLMIETPEPNLGNGVQWLHGRYARAFNIRHARSGHLFEAPYKSPLITTGAGFVRTVRYIVRNPLAAQLCREVGEWEWSSHREPRPPWVAHNRLTDRLSEIIGAPAYEDLVRASSKRSS